MSEAGLRAARTKMRSAKVSPAAIRVFEHYYAQLERGETGLIPEADIEPLVDLPTIETLPDDPAAASEALGKTVLIRPNGGLGTSMGMSRAKSLLPVRDGLSFLDLIVAQVRHARAATGARLPLLLMNSFRTQADTLRALERYPDLPVDGLPLDFLQNSEPKILADDLTPASWPADRSLEWCPPGHGDIYTALFGDGLLERLLDLGYRYAATANADNLGAAPDGRIAAWFAASGAPYAAEVTPRTPADLKGGHLAVRRSDGRVILRETAQTAPEEMRYFTDGDRHPYAHTNNLWFDLEALHRALTEREGLLGLPLIRNAKTLDPTDPDSPAVYQIETAMGAAIGSFPGATALVVGRDRFLPVKTTNDLMVVRSDAYALGRDGVPRLVSDRTPLVTLDSRHYRRIADFDAHFPHGTPSLREASSLSVAGAWTFGSGVRARGDAALADPGEPVSVPDYAVVDAGGVRRTAPRPTGAQYELRHGDQVAVVTEVGAHLRQYRVGERDVIVPFGEDDLPSAVHGGVLWPWPNRIRDGRYAVDGVEYQLDLSEPERHNAIHGLVRSTRWTLAGRGPGWLTLALDLLPSVGYPFALRAELRYALGDDGLEATLTTTNLTDAAAPLGVGFHPWLSPGAHRLDDCTLQVDAGRWVRADDRLLPVEETALPAEFDFRQARPLGATVLDDGFVDVPQGRAWVRLTDPDGVQAACWFEEGFACWQLCTGDGLPGAARAGLAAEPMTCTADAFRTGDRLVRLEPWASHTCRFGLSLTRAD